jgi:acetylornithine/succinyldiaminopimelate/putrescine aminotransferase
LLGLDIGKPARPVVEQGLAEGFLLNVVQGNVLRFLPPYLLERKHVDAVMELLHRLLVGGGTSAQRKETLMPAAV